MEKGKNTENGQGIDVEPTVLHHTLGVFAVVKDENGEEREVDLRDIVGSKGENKEENNK